MKDEPLNLDSPSRGDLVTCPSGRPGVVTRIADGRAEVRYTDSEGRRDFEGVSLLPHMLRRRRVRSER